MPAGLRILKTQHATSLPFNIFPAVACSAFTLPKESLWGAGGTSCCTYMAWHVSSPPSLRHLYGVTASPAHANKLLSNYFCLLPFAFCLIHYLCNPKQFHCAQRRHLSYISRISFCPLIGICKICRTRKRYIGLTSGILPICIGGTTSLLSAKAKWRKLKTK